ncbi:MAG: RecX family transcriptional regulator [Myxococcota bacterium]
MDSNWLGQHARLYASRWESSEASVSTLLERKIRERCARTDESAEAAMTLIPSVIEGLVEQNYVDDLRFAKGVHERQRRRGASSAQIRAKLLAKGIGASLLGSLFASESEDAEARAAWRFAKRRQLGPYCRDPEKREAARERHLSALFRAGFDEDRALRIIDAETIPQAEAEVAEEKEQLDGPW